MASLWRMRSKRISQPDAAGFSFIFAIVVASLLIIGMTWPNPTPGVGIDLPRASTAVPMRRSTSKNAIIVGVWRDGTIWVGNERTNSTVLVERIRALKQRTSESKVYIKASARVHYGAVAAVLDSVRDAGIQNVAFIVDQRH